MALDAMDPLPFSKRVPSLDGLRAVSIFFVLISHSAHALTVPLPGREILRDFGLLGVKVFFVISGFLITGLLVAEQRRTGGVALDAFYLRRSLRIFPAAYALIAVTAFLSSRGMVHLREGDLLHAVTFTVNFHQDRGWALGNLWSLGVEEQFYLIWPLLFVWLGTRRVMWVAIAVIALTPLLRVIWWFCFPEARAGIDENFQLVSDGLAVGCLLALLVARHGFAAIYERIPSIFFALAPVAVLTCTLLDQRPRFALTFGTPLANLSIGLILLWCVARPQSPAGRILNSSLAVFVGTISYSLYLWQQLCMDPELLPASVAPWGNLVLALAMAVCSYYLLERPFRHLRKRFKPVRSSALPGT